MREVIDNLIWPKRFWAWAFGDTVKISDVVSVTFDLASPEEDEYAYKFFSQVLVTPAMQLGVTDHICSISELMDNEAPKPMGRSVGPFRIIEGGKS